MTNEEAIKSLEAQRDCIILSCSGACRGGEECDECDFMYAKGTMGTMRQVYQMSIEALKEKKVGKWVEERTYMECPNCHDIWHYEENQTERFKFCPNCGAKMEGADKEQGEEEKKQPCGKCIHFNRCWEEREFMYIETDKDGKCPRYKEGAEE